jgi:hypothetical protein
VQEDYDAVLGPDGAAEAPPHPHTVVDRAAEIEASGYFGNVTVRRYLWNVSFDADGYIALLGTSSWHRRLDEDACRELFERLHRRISAHPERTIRPSLLGLLHLARRPPV